MVDGCSYGEAGGCCYGGGLPRRHGAHRRTPSAGAVANLRQSGSHERRARGRRRATEVIGALTTFCFCADFLFCFTVFFLF